MIMRLQRISGRKRCAYVLLKGKRFNGKHISINWLHGPPLHPNIPRTEKGVFVGIATSTKLHSSAVKRNRMRRRVREAFRLYAKDHAHLPTVQLIARPKSSTLTCTFEAIQEDVQRFFSTVSL